MYYIDDYKKRAVSKIVPYLINFPQIVKLVEYSAERYQAIEDVLWKIAENLKIDDSRGIFLEGNAVNEVLNLIYTDKAEDAFTYGTKLPLLQGYGKGHYYSQASYISGSRKTASEDKTIRAVKAKVIENNTKGTIQDLIDGLKLYFNADKIGIYESYPMAVSVELMGSNLELSSSGIYDIIKNLLGGCVSLNNVYINNKDFNTFKYNENSSYGVDRYPIKLNETIDIYQPISNAINLTDMDEEYIRVKNQTLEDKNVICLMGEFNKVQDEVILSCSDENNLFTLGVSGANIKVVNGGVEYDTNVIAELNKPYTFLLYNDNGSLKLWVLTSVLISGSNIDRDTSLVLNTIQNTAPIVQVDNFISPENDIYVNCKINADGSTDSYSDFIYYLLACGKIENDSLTTQRYYITCYGEKNILFNCFDNSNHLTINTQSDLTKNLTVKQSNYNYKNNHSHNRYMYLDGKSYVDYNVSTVSNSCDIENINLEFDICLPLELKSGTILSNFVGSKIESKVEFNDITRNIIFDFRTETILDDNTTMVIADSVLTPEGILELGEYSNFKLVVDGLKAFVYKNGFLIKEHDLSFKLQDTPTVVKIGCDQNNENILNGFLRNVKLDIIGMYKEDNEEPVNYLVNLDIPLTSSLQDRDKIVDYVNHGVRFITVPQLFQNVNNTDLYNNTLISNR